MIANWTLRLVKKGSGATKRASVPARERGKSLIDLAASAGLEHVHLPLHRAGSRLRVSRHSLGTPGIARIDEHAKPSCRGYQLMQNPHALCHQFGGQKVDTRHVAARPGNIGDETKCHRVLSESKDNRYCGGCRLGGERPGLGEDGHHAGATTDQIGCQFRKTIVLAFRPAIFDDDAATLDITGLSQGLAKGGKAAAHRNVGRRGAEKSDRRHRRLLRARRKRPRGCSAAEQRDELAPRYVEHGGVLPRFVPTKRTQGITERTAGPWATPEMF